MAEYKKGYTDITPEQAGFSRRYLELMENHYRKLVESKRVYGAGFLMSRRGQIFAHQTLGKQTFEKDSPDLDPGNLKGWASITKILTATAVMRCLEEGKLWLDQPVAEIIPDFDTDLHKKITIQHLITHTSGLMADPGYFCEPNPKEIFGKLDKTDLLKMMLEGPLQSEPGTRWSYSSLSFHILAEIVSRVSGKHFYDYMTDEIFKPMGMNDTYFEVPEERRKEICMADNWVLDALKDRSKRDPKPLPYGGGGAFGTMQDLFKLGQAYCNGGEYNGFRLLGKNTVRTMTTNRLKGVPAFHWGAQFKAMPMGLGWELSCDGSTCSEEVFCHEGFGWSSLYVDPVDDFIYISFVIDESGFDPEVMVKPRVMAFAGVE